VRIGPLLGGGLNLSWRCPSRCRHCLYGCGPHRAAPDEGRLEAALDLLAERAPQARLHIGGGEPFLHRELLERAVAGLQRRGLVLEYVETNASWAKDRAGTEEALRRLADVGLTCLLVSVSPFHAEFVPPARTLSLAEAAQRLLPGGAFLWVPGFLPDLAAEPRDERLDLEGRIAERGAEWALGLAGRYGLIAAGRAGRYLHTHGRRVPWRDLLGEGPCTRRLCDTSHFHVDLQGRYVPGLCAGLALPLAEVPGEVDLGRYPVLAALARDGVAGVVALAREAGFEPEPTYAAACDLCQAARVALFPQGHAELSPPGFYDSRSLAG